VRIKSIIKVIILGCLGGAVIGISTGKWIAGFLFCLGVAAVSGFLNKIKKRN
jgi:hypothetical protein